MSSLHAYSIDGSDDAINAAICSMSDPDLIAARLNEGTSDGVTPLMYACRYGRSSTAVLLLNLGANIFEKDVNGSTAINYTISYRKPRVLATLLDWLKDSSKFSSSSSSVITNNDKIKSLLNSRTNIGNTVIHEACNSGDFDGLKILLDYDFIDVNAVNRDGHTPLHFAADNESTRSIELLLSRGANCFVYDSQGLSPFHLACIYKNKDAAMLLVKSGGFDPNSSLIAAADSDESTKTELPSFVLKDHFDSRFIQSLIDSYAATREES
jgi:ankyrin repeat protein